jgi:hypothetical protein
VTGRDVLVVLRALGLAPFGRLLWPAPTLLSSRQTRRIAVAQIAAATPRAAAVAAHAAG